jgi:hypothetical protein
MTRILSLFAALAIAAASPAVAQNLSIAAFYGTFQGNGVAENEDSAYFAMTPRDFDVVTAPIEGGFTITWTSVIREGGDPKAPNVRRKSTTRTFAATGTGIWRAKENGDPVTGGEVSWARLSRNTLSIYAMTVEKDGAYEVQRYDRTLSGTGMDLTFTRTKDGERTRRVKGKLVKQAR